MRNIASMQRGSTRSAAYDYDIFEADSDLSGSLEFDAGVRPCAPCAVRALRCACPACSQAWHACCA